MRNWFNKEILAPRGLWSLASQVSKGNPARASVANNVRVSPGVIESRPGTSLLTTVASGKVTGVFNWISSYLENLVLFQAGGYINRLKQSDGTVYALLSGLTTTRAPVFAPLGSLVYFCGYDVNGAGTFPVRIYNGGFTNEVPDVDMAFRGPLQVTSFTATDGGDGQCTEGVHQVGFVFQSRSGFTGQPSPVDGSGVFVPATVTLNAGLRSISVSITLDCPSDAGTTSEAYPIMTRADNPAQWYFVPSGMYSNDPWILPVGALGYSTTFTISISDEDLANRAEDALPQFDLIVGGGPPYPNFVVPAGRRMLYGVGNVLYASNVDAPQEITAVDNVVQMPNRWAIGMAFQLPGSTDIFITGEKWTGRVTDNNDLPSTWATPVMVSNAIGAPFPECVEYGTAGSYAWVACETGLYVFNGTYPNHPITYLCSDLWARINWKTGAFAVKVKDDVLNLKCYVAVPLDGATECTHQFVIDYTNGIKYDTCDITLDNFDAATFSAIGVVKEYATGKTVLWIGPSAAGYLSHFDDTTHNDNGSAIHCAWESGLIRGANEVTAGLIRVGYADLWIHGAGSLTSTWYNQDRTLSATPVLMTNGDVTSALATAPGLEFYQKFDLHPCENFSFRLETNAVDAWFRLSGFRPSYRASAWNR